MDVIVYSAGPSCQRCRLTCRRLDELGISYELVDLHDVHNATVRTFLAEELGYREAPVVEIDHGVTRWSGFHPDLIDGLATTSDQPGNGEALMVATPPSARG